MKKLLILGTGCAACTKLAALVVRAADELEIEIDLEKTGDIERILVYDVASTPALVVDGVVRLAGRVPPIAELKQLMQ
jgi:small redox-active disulfide protein 2